VTHEQVRELLSAFALDALNPDEAHEVLAHLPTCEECRDELASLRQVTDALGTSVVQVSAPAALWASVLAAVRPSPGVVVLTRGWALGLAVGATGLIVVLAAATVSLDRRLAALSQRLAAEERVLPLLTAPSTKSVSLAGEVQAAARFIYDPALGQGALIVSNLRDPGREFVYQLWLVSGTRPESAGVFRPISGQPLVLPVAVDFTRYQAVAISVERAPFGAPQPTTTPILLGKI
jgi:hypothetical protein